MTHPLKSLLAILATSMGVLTIVAPASASVVSSPQPDSLLGSRNLGNSSPNTELSGLKSVLTNLNRTADANAATFSQKIESNSFTSGQSPVLSNGLVTFNLSSSFSSALPAYFSVKLGTGQTGLESHYFFQNLASTSQLVFAVSSLGPSSSAFNIGRISHYTLYGPTGATTVQATVPAPATALLLLGAWGVWAAVRRRR